MHSFKLNFSALACFTLLAGVVLAEFTFQDASLSLTPSNKPDETDPSWVSANETFVSPDQSGNGVPVTITITRTARPIPEDQIFVGLIASLALIYDKNLPPAGFVPVGGFEITFVAGLRHAIFLEPLSGQRVNWATADSILKALGLTVFNKRTNTEILFDVTVNGRRVARGGVTDNPKAKLSMEVLKNAMSGKVESS
ncbi:MAG: hypothetical protein Q9164_004677 [Protoblastenia rupestris]